MPAKKGNKEKEIPKKGRESEEEEGYLLEEDDEEEEVDYVLADNAEEKVEEALAVLGAPAIIHHYPEEHEHYPTEAHRKCQVKYTPGDHAPPHNEFLIIRK